MPQLSQSQLLPPDHVFEKKFRILSTIGAGGVGVIYKAQHLHTKRLLAIKMLHSKELDQESEFLRFQQEAEAASHLHHKNIVTIHDFGVTADDVAFLVMEFLDGPTIDQIIRTEGRIHIDRFMQIFPQVCAGLHHAHKKGIVHRDIKPSNLMIIDEEDEKGVVKIVDFGSAKPSQQQVDKHLTQTGVVLGTPMFMSPEQCRGRDVDFHTDIYSLGCVMYAALTGRYPFEGESVMDTLYKHMAEPPPPFSQAAPELNLPYALEAVILKTLSKEQTQRQSSMQELSEDLVAAINDAHTAKVMPVRSVSEFVRGAKSDERKAPSPALTKTLLNSAVDLPAPQAPARAMPRGTTSTPNSTLRYSQNGNGITGGGNKKGLALAVAVATIALVCVVSVMHSTKHEAAMKKSADKLASAQNPSNGNLPDSKKPTGKETSVNTGSELLTATNKNKTPAQTEEKHESKTVSQPAPAKVASVAHALPRIESHTSAPRQQTVQPVPAPPLSIEQQAMQHKVKGDKAMTEHRYGDALPEFQAYLATERQVHGEYAPQLLPPISRVVAALHAEHNEDTVRNYLSEAETIVQRNGVADSATAVADKVKHADSVWRALAVASFHLANLYEKDEYDLSIQQYKWSLAFFELAFKTWNEPNDPHFISAQQNAQKAREMVSAAETPQVTNPRPNGLFAKYFQRRRLEKYEGGRRMFGR